MPSRPWGSLGLRPRDPPGSGRHYFFPNNALEGILIIILLHPMLPIILIQVRSALQASGYVFVVTNSESWIKNNILCLLCCYFIKYFFSNLHYDSENGY